MREYFHPSLSKESIESTIEAWQPLSKEPLTEKDAIGILTSVFGFLNGLANTDDGQKIMMKAGQADSKDKQRR